jgi:hypothetical protein
VHGKVSRPARANCSKMLMFPQIRLRIPLMSIMHSDLMPITISNYNRKTDQLQIRNTDRHHFGIVIDISSER